MSQLCCFIKITVFITVKKYKTMTSLDLQTTSFKALVSSKFYNGLCTLLCSIANNDRVYAFYIHLFFISLLLLYFSKS